MNSMPDLLLDPNFPQNSIYYIFIRLFMSDSLYHLWQEIFRIPDLIGWRTNGNGNPKWNQKVRISFRSQFSKLCDIWNTFSSYRYNA